MRIRKLELQGFKSFVDRQTFHFGDGIAGVVGPNGCGKSNVVDSVKWCIGEQSAKSLRGAAMQDVIFNGSAGRPPVNFAEVTISFVVGDEPFPGQWARFEELQVTRRLYRDGSSIYMLNGAKVRLKDVQDLFMDTGVGRKLYSFIEQGKVDQMIHALPEQRRLLIEEAAGISRFRERRREALERLESTQTNLERAADLADEMGRQLRNLERQVGRAVRYRRYQDRVRQAELFLGLARYRGLTGDRREISGQMREVEREATALDRDLEQRDRGLSDQRDAIAVMESVLGAQRDELSELEAQRREQESARHYQARERDELARRLEVLEVDLDNAAIEGRKAAEEAGVLEIELASLQKEHARSEEQAQQGQERAGALSRQLQDLRSRIDALKAQVMKHVTDLTRLRTQLTHVQQREDETRRRLSGSESHRESVGTDMSRLEAAVSQEISAAATAETRLETCRAEATAAKKALAEAEVSVRQRQEEAQRAEKALTESERALARLEARLRSLEELSEAHAGVEGGAKALLSRAATLGTLAENLDVPESMEALLARALAGGLDYVLLAGERELESAVQLSRGGGPAGLVLSTPGDPAGGLAACIGGSEVGRAALSRVLGDCREAPDFQEAWRIWKETGRRVVSGSGEVILESGVVLVGRSDAGAGQAILRRRREIAALSEQVEAARRELAASKTHATSLQESAAVAATSLIQIRGQVESANARLNAAQLAQVEARHRVDSRRGELARQREQADRLERQKERLEQDLAGFVAEIDRHFSGIRASDGAREAAEEELRALQSRWSSMEDEVNRARDSAARLQAERGALRQRVVLLEKNLESAHHRSKDAAQRTERAAAERLQSAERITSLDADDARLMRQIQSLGERQGDLRVKMDAEKTRLKAAREKLAEAESTLSELRSKLEKARTRHSRLEIQLHEIKAQIESLRLQAEEKYQASLPGLLDRLERDAALLIEVGAQSRVELPFEVKGLPEVEDLRITPKLLEDEALIRKWVEQLADAREQIQRVGEVNLAALQEYQEVSTRHQELEAQRQDLESSVDTIRKTIAKINRTCRERFRETFDRVNQYFRELYPRLVGGGQAQLKLTDEEDLLETGVEILVQPPGKRLQNLTLLSGGEKAMTAIALLFALFKVKPSPFCLLDEVDAPLDEGNGARFNDMLREMSQLSQFIVITHNKKTIEAVDTLYGVTMPDPGVSRLVTVRVQ